MIFYSSASLQKWAGGGGGGGFRGAEAWKRVGGRSKGEGGVGGGVRRWRWRGVRESRERHFRGAWRR